jgi:large subunit ribosomal protein L13
MRVGVPWGARPPQVAGITPILIVAARIPHTVSAVWLRPVPAAWPRQVPVVRRRPDQDKKRRLTTVRTYTPKPADVQRQWYVIDATDVVLGRLASQVSILLRGKHKPIYAPHLDTGDFVIIVNADKVSLSGKKLEQKRAYRHSGYPGGLRSIAYGDLLAKHPERAVEKAIKGMLPHNTLGRKMFGKVKVYAGAAHPHQAQQPVPYEITQVAQ